MRVSGASSRFATDERGVAGTMVAILLVVLLGSGAVAVDLGNLWASRRHAVTASDAGSLATAKEYALGRNGCGNGTPEEYVEERNDAGLVSCEHRVVGANSGLVTVWAAIPVDFQFASIFGVDDRDAASGTTTAYGLLGNAAALRPMGVCMEHPIILAWYEALSNGITQWDPANNGFTDPNIYNDNETLGGCDGAPGNWGMLDLNCQLDGSGDCEDPDNSDKETQTWVAVGCLPNEPSKSWCPNGVDIPSEITGDVGTLAGSIGDELAVLQASQTHFCLPVFDKNPDRGVGQNAVFSVVDTVPVIVKDFKVTESDDERYLYLTFDASQSCPGSPRSGGLGGGSFALAICDIDEEQGTDACFDDD